MPVETKRSFTIVGKKCETTGGIFGPEYGGQFTVRRPTLEDRTNISIKHAANLSKFGPTGPGSVEPNAEMISYIFSNLAIIGEEKPEWFDPAKMYDDTDEEAVIVVWEEVKTFLDSFRSKRDRGTGADGGADNQVLVSEQIPITTE